MNSVRLFISPQENATKIGWCSIDCVLQWFWFKDTPFISIKLMSLGKSKQWVCILISQKAFRNIATPLCSEIMSCWLHFYGEICQKVFPPSDFHIYADLMNTSWHLCILCTSGGRKQVMEQSGGALHVCCWNSRAFSTNESKQTSTKNLQKVYGGRLKQMIILSAVLVTLISTLSQSVPLIQAWTGRWTSFHKPSEREQKLVRLNMQQAAHVGDVQPPKYFRGNSNLFKVSHLECVCACAKEPISLPTWPTIQRFFVVVSRLSQHISWLVALN